MFYDWLSCHQDFDRLLPVVSDRLEVYLDTASGDILHQRQPAVMVEGSHDTRVQIRVAGARLSFSGNPSRWGRQDNLFGFTSLDDCFEVVNRAVAVVFSGCEWQPRFTRSTKVWMGRGDNAQMVGDGVKITRLDVTTNIETGKGNEYAYQRALSNLPYRNSIPQFFSNGCTTHWKTKSGKKSRLIDAKTYLKAEEIELHLLPRVIRKHGKGSSEAGYVERLINFCRERGTVRFEQSLRAEFLAREGLNFWGRFDEQRLVPIHTEFLNLDEKLKVTAMDIETIADRLIAENICKSTQSANATASYAIRWMHGETFDRGKSQVRTNRARLRAIGMDIYQKCDLTRHSPVFVTKVRQVNVRPLSVPSFYQKPVARAA